MWCRLTVRLTERDFSSESLFGVFFDGYYCFVCQCRARVVPVSLLLVSMERVAASATWLASSEALVGMLLCKQSAVCLPQQSHFPVSYIPPAPPCPSGVCGSCPELPPSGRDSDGGIAGPRGSFFF